VNKLIEVKDALEQLQLTIAQKKYQEKKKNSQERTIPKQKTV